MALPLKSWSADVPRRCGVARLQPAPFAKGPLMVFCASLAGELAFGAHSVAIRAAASRLFPNTRVNIDLMLGHILATANNGLGAENLTVVDIGVSRDRDDTRFHGFAELRPLRDLTDWRYGCHRVVHMHSLPLKPCLRVSRSASLTSIQWTTWLTSSLKFKMLKPLLLCVTLS